MATLRWTAALVAVIVGGWLVFSFTRPLLVMAHRGDVERWPENTLEAIVSAVERGADGIEFDVQRSADGTWWVLHDRDVTASTDGHGLFRLKTDAEIEALTIAGGLGYDPRRHPGLRIPRLATVLAALADYPGALQVDVKSSLVEAHAEVAELLTALHLPNAIYISCRSPAAAAAVKGVNPAMITVMIEEFLDDPAVDAWALNATWNLTPERWSDSLRGTLEVFVVEDTLDDEQTMIPLARLVGVEVWITNDLDAFE